VIDALKLLPGNNVAEAVERPIVPLQTPPDRVAFSVSVRLSICRNPPSETLLMVSVRLKLADCESSRSWMYVFRSVRPPSRPP
jgi:hypothetical protein